MKERPMHMSAPMVRALLAGTKTQTRRVIKPQPQMVTDRTIKTWDGDADALLGLLTTTGKSCPYGQPGDRLWVRETWQYADWTQDGEPWIRYRADGAQRLCEHVPEEWADRLTNTWAGLSTGIAIGEPAADRKWRPAIRMPRWASRILLEITAVRVERLRDISEADAQAEGCAVECMTPTGDDSGSAIHGPGGYRALWDTINAAGSWDTINGAGSWDANPWVWVVEFKRVMP